MKELRKKVYVSEIVAPNSIRGLLGRWKDRVKKYKCERSATRGGGFEQAGSAWIGRGGGSFAVALEDVPGGSKV